jgi:hypothetical protein
MRVRAVYPIFPILRTDSNIFRENYRGLIEHLSAEREISIRGDWHGGEKLAVRITRFTKAQRNQLPKKFLLEPRWSVEFSGSFKFPGSKEFNVKDQDGNIIETLLQTEGRSRSGGGNWLGFQMQWDV